MLITTACTDYIEPFANPDLNGNNISLNTDKEWTTCQLPTFIGNISTLPADLQNVIRKRFPNIGIAVKGLEYQYSVIIFLKL